MKKFSGKNSGEIFKEPRNYSIGLRVGKTLNDAVRTAAKVEDRSVANWITKLLLEHFEKS